MNSWGTWLERAGRASAALTLTFASACGQVSDGTPTIIGEAGTAGSRDLGGSAGTHRAPIALDLSDCAVRPISDCQGVKSLYLSDSQVFDEAPELAQCTQFSASDGCSSIQFSFDADGCAATVTWQSPGASEALPELRQCLAAALETARWPCLALGKLRYEESCFIH